MKASIESIIRSHYFRYAIIPILLIELALLVLYFAINGYVSAQNGNHVMQESRANLQQIVQSEARSIDLQLQEIDNTLHFLQQQQQHILQQSDAWFTALKGETFATSATGVYYKQQDNGGAAVTVSNRQPLTAEIREKVRRSGAFDELFAAAAFSNPRAVAVYYTTPWHMTRYYPWFEGMEAFFPADYDISNYSFFYEADPQRNPDRNIVWTGAYLDPAGQGWLTSGIVPIYNGDAFEGVTGIDVTIDSLASTLMALELPYQSAPMLLDDKGSILAMSDAAGQVLGLRELKDHRYQQAISGDVFKPDSFSLFDHQNAQLSAAVKAAVQGQTSEGVVTIKGEGYFLYQSSIQQTQWSLLVLVPESAIYGPVRELGHLSEQIGFMAIMLMVLFYIVFFFYLQRNAHQIAQEISEPIRRLAQLTAAVGALPPGKQIPESGIAELDQLSRNFHTMSCELNERTRKLVEAELDRRTKARLAHTDFLTGVSNRRAFDIEMQRLLSTMTETDAPFALLAIDIDHFKAVNDCYGHACGDKVLIAVAAMFQEHAGEHGLVARLGGEEFAVVLQAEMNTAVAIAERIRTSIANAPLLPGVTEPVTVSIGITQLTRQCTVHSCLSHADDALYQAKRAGRNRVIIATSTQLDNCAQQTV